MNAKLGRYATVFLAIFVAGALYGVCWEHYRTGDINILGPATVEELAQVRAGMTKPTRQSVSIPLRTNANLPAQP